MSLCLRGLQPHDSLPPHAGIPSITGQVRCKHHLQPAKSTALVAAGNCCLKSPHHQSHGHLVGPGQSQSGRHTRGWRPASGERSRGEGGGVTEPASSGSSNSLSLPKTAVRGVKHVGHLQHKQHPGQKQNTTLNKVITAPLTGLGVLCAPSLLSPG